MVLKIDFEDDDYVYQTDTIKDKMNITKEAIKKNEYLMGLIDNGIKSSKDAYNYMQGYFDGLMDTACNKVSKDKKESNIQTIKDSIREYDEANNFYGYPYLKKGMIVQDTKQNGIYYIHNASRFTNQSADICEHYEIFFLFDANISIKVDISDYFFITIDSVRKFIDYKGGSTSMTINICNYDDFKSTTKILRVLSEDDQRSFDRLVNDYEEKMNHIYDIATARK